MELIAGYEDILLAAAFVIFGAAVLLLMPSVISSWLVRHLVQSDGAKLVGLVAGATGFIVLLFTAYQISVDLEDRIELRSELREDAIERYRSVLLRRAPGNTGKGEAITNIHDRGGSLEGWDASCEAVGLWDAVQRLPGGLDTELTSFGRPLSARQADLLVLARVLASEPRLLLLDGVLDGLDERTHALLFSHLRERPPCTVIVATQRRDVAQRCARIVELDDRGTLRSPTPEVQA